MCATSVCFSDPERSIVSRPGVKCLGQPGSERGPFRGVLSFPEAKSIQAFDIVCVAFLVSTLAFRPSHDGACGRHRVFILRRGHYVGVR